jgi:metal-sulfur cluster biosynthetic enzyme
MSVQAARVVDERDPHGRPRGVAPTVSSPYPYSGPEELREPVLAALRRVVDPEVAMTIVDVGLVYGVTVTSERLHVLLTMTSAACPVTDVIVDDVGAELDKVAPEVAIDVELAWDPPWTTDRMSPRAKAFMGW